MYFELVWVVTHTWFLDSAGGNFEACCFEILYFLIRIFGLFGIGACSGQVILSSNCIGIIFLYIFLGPRLYGEGTCSKPGLFYFIGRPRDSNPGTCGPGPGTMPLGYHTSFVWWVRLGIQLTQTTDLHDSYWQISSPLPPQPNLSCKLAEINLTP